MKRATFVSACILLYVALCVFSVWAWIFALGRLARFVAVFP